MNNAAAAALLDRGQRQGGRLTLAGCRRMVRGMSLISRITRTPLAFDPDAAADLVAGFADLPPELRGLMAATAGVLPI